jgi:DegV family protein with EDD domain
MKIILDSASNVRTLPYEDYKIVPLTICTDEKEYKDDENLDVLGMVSDLEKTKSKSHSACPSVTDFLNAIGDSDETIIINLASVLSGCHNSAHIACEQYMEDHPGSKAYALDTRKIGPVQHLIALKAIELSKEGKSTEEIFNEISEYSAKHLGIGFCLGSLKNLANNGRISPAVAKIADVINLRITGIFDADGKLAPTDKCRGDKKNIEALVKNMKNDGYHGGKVIIDHCDGLSFAESVKARILTDWPDADVTIGVTTGLCSFYAERTGIVMGYETN